MKIKVSNNEFVDTSNMVEVYAFQYDARVLYVTPESSRYFMVYPPGTRTFEPGADELDVDDAYDVVVSASTDASQINGIITQHFPDKPWLQEIR